MMSIVNWVDAAMAALDSHVDVDHESIPLDRLLGSNYEPAQSVVVARELLDEFIIAYRGRHAELMARLVIPLAVSNELSASPPDLSDLQNAISPFEPPSLYLSRRNYALRPSNNEEYNLPLRNGWPSGGGFLMYRYSCYRDPLAIANRWDYYRALWIEHYPIELRPPTDAT
jgi:hypothetical protein